MEIHLIKGEKTILRFENFENAMLAINRIIKQDCSLMRQGIKNMPLTVEIKEIP